MRHPVDHGLVEEVVPPAMVASGGRVVHAAMIRPVCSAQRRHALLLDLGKTPQRAIHVVGVDQVEGMAQRAQVLAEDTVERGVVL